jgi:hypothetical protein
LSQKIVTISELEFKTNHLLGENEHILLENERLNGELIRLEEVYGGKIRELEGHIAV